MNTALNKTGVAILTNKSGGSVAQGDTVIVDTANASSFTTTTTSGFVNGLIGVVVEPAGIANNAAGLVAFGIWTPILKLNTAATIGQFIKHHSAAKQGTPHDAPMVAGDFAVALEASATPKALLLGSIFQGGGSGAGLVLLEEQTPSSVATVDITSGLDDTYDEYEVRFSLAPATDAVVLRLLLSTDGGSTWLSSNYKQALKGLYSDGFAFDDASNGAAHISLTGETGNGSGEYVHGVLVFSNLASTSLQKLIGVSIDEIAQQPKTVTRRGAAQQTTTSAVNAIQLKFSSGNIASGWVRLYGLQKS